MELTLKHRPKLFKDLIGQEKAVDILKGFFKKKELPRQIIMTGPSGVGKTSAARIIKLKTETGAWDYKEINAANDNGIDMIRNLEDYCRLRPTNSKYRIYLIDEVHQLTKQAQNAFLKILEEPPAHVIFILCTTDPGKIISTVETRCKSVPFQLVSDDNIAKIVNRVIKKEGIATVSKKVVAAIAEAADGSPRRALNTLESVIEIENEKKQLKAIVQSSTKLQCIDLIRAVAWNNKIIWKEVAAKLKAIEDEPEIIRKSILGYASAVLLNGQQNDRLQFFLIAFEANTYDGGRASIVRALYEVVTRCQR